MTFNKNVTKYYARNLVVSLSLAIISIPIRHAHSGTAGADVSAADYPSLQAAIDDNPGRMVYVPQGEYVLDTALCINDDGTGLYGYGTIVQSNPEADFVAIDQADNVRIRDLTFTRPEARQEATADGVSCRDCRNVVLDGIRISNNKSQGASIRIMRCANCTVERCEIRDYKRIGIDDRTGSELYGYAFHCIDGTGINVRQCTGTIIRNNRIVEIDLVPSVELKEKHQLGSLTEGRHPTRFGELGVRATGDHYTNAWHQGSAIIVTGPSDTRHTIITGNYIENAAQGVDMHCDLAVCSDNIVTKAMIGLKATHGCRNLLLNGNLLTHIDLWGILVNPSAASHFAAPATDEQEAKPANVDGGIVVANNIITDYGEGNEYWNWGGVHEDGGSSYAIALLAAQLPTNPPLRDILVHGNIVYDSTRDELPGSDGQQPQPNYRYAIYIEPGEPAPLRIRCFDNILDAGRSGVANVALEP